MNQTLRLLFFVQLVACMIGAFGCGGDDSKNECAEEKEIRMNAIIEKCSETNLAGCCYCSCEINGVPTEGCTCQEGKLIRDTDVENCTGGALQTAVTCVQNSDSCADRTKTGVFQYCQ